MSFSPQTQKICTRAQDVISSVMLDRLRLTKDRIAAMADGMRQVAKLPDPVEEILAEVKRPNGLVIRKNCGSDGCRRHYLRKPPERYL